jgi:hypothetical protein
MYLKYYARKNKNKGKDHVNDEEKNIVFRSKNIPCEIHGN